MGTSVSVNGARARGRAFWRVQPRAGEEGGGDGAECAAGAPRPPGAAHLAALLALLPGAVRAGEVSAREGTSRTRDVCGLLTPESGLHQAVVAARSASGYVEH
jgi:hypothetical protein